MTSDHIERDGPKRPARPSAGLHPDSQRRIGRHLRALYAEALTQPLPARFEALLDALSGPSPDAPSKPSTCGRPA